MNIKENGFEIHSGFLSHEWVRVIIAEIEALDLGDQKHGIRNAEKKFTSVKKLVESDLLRHKAKSYLPRSPELVRVIIFDKTPDKNWFVTWHQDKTIAVSHKYEIEGWGPWTVKDGVHHVQPTLHVLEEMITFRIHLDDANERNGCLKVIPKSQRLGILNKIEQDLVVAGSAEYVCSVKSGDLLVMRPHLLHSSSKAMAPSHRRILHVEYSSFQLPKGLAWV